VRRKEPQKSGSWLVEAFRRNVLRLNSSRQLLFKRIEPLTVSHCRLSEPPL